MRVAAQAAAARRRLRGGCRQRARRLRGRLPGVGRAGLLLWVLGRRLRMCSLNVCKDPVQSMEQQSRMHDEARIAGGCRSTSDLASASRCLPQMHVSTLRGFKQPIAHA